MTEEKDKAPLHKDNSDFHDDDRPGSGIPPVDIIAVGALLGGGFMLFAGPAVTISVLTIASMGF